MTVKPKLFPEDLTYRLSLPRSPPGERFKNRLFFFRIVLCTSKVLIFRVCSKLDLRREGRQVISLFQLHTEDE